MEAPGHDGTRGRNVLQPDGFLESVEAPLESQEDDVQRNVLQPDGFLESVEAPLESNKDDVQRNVLQPMEDVRVGLGL